MAIFSITSEIHKERVKLLNQNKKPSKVTLSVDQAFDLLDEFKDSYHEQVDCNTANSISLTRDEERLIEFLKGLYVYDLEVVIVRLVS